MLFCVHLPVAANNFPICEKTAFELPWTLGHEEVDSRWFDMRPFNGISSQEFGAFSLCF